MARPKWQVALLQRLFGGIFIFAWMTRLPIVGRFLYQRLFDKDSIFFIPIDESVRQPEQVALPLEIVRHFIRNAGAIWIKNRCVCRSSMGCENYPADLGCIYLGDEVMNFNPDLGRTVSVEEALEHLRKCADAGLMQMIGLNKIDSLMLNCAPADRLMTICNCCECCCFFRILPNLDEPIRKKIQGLPFVNVVIGEDCTGCGVCVDACFVRAISMKGGRAMIEGDCIRCGKCVRACPGGHIAIEISDPVFVERTIDSIEAIVEDRGQERMQ